MLSIYFEFDTVFFMNTVFSITISDSTIFDVLLLKNSKLKHSLSGVEVSTRDLRDHARFDSAQRTIHRRYNENRSYRS